MDIHTSEKAFTLIELIIVVVIVAILAAIAYPSYSYFIERKDLALAQKEALLIASELEKFKSKNLSYKNFSAEHLYSTAYDKSNGKLLIPVSSAAGEEKFILTLIDKDDRKSLSDPSVVGLNWVIRVERAESAPSKKKQPNNYDLLLTSTGLKCKSKTNNAFDNFDNGKSDCKSIDSQSEIWE